MGRSCHWLGNWYLDPGDHHFNFSFTSAAGDWRNSYHEGTAGNQPLIAVCGEKVKASQGLPESGSFVSIDHNNVIVSTVKRADDTGDYIIRLYEMEGKDTPVKVTFPLHIRKAWMTDMIEENPVEIPVNGKSLELKIGHNAIETYRISVN